MNSLYAVYQDAAPGFARKYLDMLRAGGTKRHKELLAPFGLDASDPAFWDGASTSSAASSTNSSAWEDGSLRTPSPIALRACPALSPLGRGLGRWPTMRTRSGARLAVRARRTAVGGLAARLAGERYLGVPLDRGRHAADLKAALGGMKGPLMKVAQLLSTIPDALPEEYVAANSPSCRRNAPSMGWPFVKRRMAAELGAGLAEEVQELRA